MDNVDKIGRYEIKDEIGRGGMATVYHAYDPRFERDVAVKVLPHQLLHDPTFRQRFEREAKIIAALEHVAIVPVHDFGEENGQPYLVMRLMSGGSLAERILDATFSLVEAVDFIAHIAPALDYAHAKGVVHRDLKPGNILFDQHNAPFVSDFGIAKLSVNSPITSSNAIVGTPAYMSPEQGRGEKDIDGRSDIYALGAILFEMLTGRPPYEAETPTGQIIKHIIEPIPLLADFRPDLPADCQVVFECVMAKSRDERYGKVSEFVQALSAIINGNYESLAMLTQMDDLSTQSFSSDEQQVEHHDGNSAPAVVDELTLDTGARERRQISRPRVLAIIGFIAAFLLLVLWLVAVLPNRLFGSSSLSVTSTSSLSTTQTMLSTDNDSISRASGIFQPLTELATPSLTPSPSLTVTPLPDVLVRLGAANVRVGPGTSYPVLTTVFQDTLLQVLGRNRNGTWLAIALPDTDVEGWIALSVLDIDAETVKAFPTVIPPPSPTPRPTERSTDGGSSSGGGREVPPTELPPPTTESAYPG